MDDSFWNFRGKMLVNKKKKNPKYYGCFWFFIIIIMVYILLLVSLVENLEEIYRF